MIVLDKKLEKAILSSALQREEYNFISDIINSTGDISAPVKALNTYAKHTDVDGPIAKNHSLHDHVKLSISILNKLDDVTLTKYDLVDKD